ncbi:MAG TPA: hypothetical protein VEG43_04520 [Dehalococcoidia bacterium]|nr:hypothetical protein [Dehalococcoidia bacterium]
MAANRITIKPPQIKRKLNGAEYILTKIDYSKADAEAEKAYHEKLGRVAQIVEEGGFWLVYTKIGVV